MIEALIWEPHHRTGGGVLVRAEDAGEQGAIFRAAVERGVSYVQWLPPAWLQPQRCRGGGRARRRYLRIDKRAHLPRPIVLTGVHWGASFLGCEWRAIVFATEQEHVDDREAIRLQLNNLRERGFRR